VNAELKEWSEAKYAKNIEYVNNTLVVKGYKNKPTSEEQTMNLVKKVNDKRVNGPTLLQ
jgi:hypothetical protein